MLGFTKQVIIRDLFHFLFTLHDRGRFYSFKIIETHRRFKLFFLICIFYLIFLLKKILLVLASLIAISDRGDSLIFIWLLFHLFQF